MEAQRLHLFYLIHSFCQFYENDSIFQKILTFITQKTLKVSYNKCININKGGNKMRTPNYHDFYQMALIPIGNRDLTALQESETFIPEYSFTHWLIAVEGVQLPQAKIYFHWKVSIYPATSDGNFNWKVPYYCSENMEVIDHAISLGSSFVSFAKKDALTEATLLEKIS